MVGSAAASWNQLASSGRAVLTAALVLLGAWAAGFIIAVSPKGALLAISGIAVGALIVYRPVVPAGALFLAYPFYGRLVLAHASTAVLASKDIIVLALFVRAIPLLRRRSPLPRAFWLLGAGWALTIACSAALNATPVGTAIAGLRADLEPLTALAIGAAYVTARHRRWLVLASVIPVGANLIAARHQLNIGVPGLLHQGYVYGEAVRQASTGALRAFGYFVDATPFGQTMGAIAIVAAVLAADERSALAKFALALTGALAAAGMVLSLNRTALIAVLVTAGTVGLSASGGQVPGIRRLSRPAKTVGIVAMAVLLVALAIREGGSVFSSAFQGDAPTLNTRLLLWQTAENHLRLLGAGPGSAGAATLSSLSTSAGHATQTVDNYYLTCAVQYGVVGLALYLGMLGLLLRRAWMMCSAGSVVALALLSYLAVSSITTNLWEDFPTPYVILMLLGSALAGSRGGRLARGAHAILG